MIFLKVSSHLTGTIIVDNLENRKKELRKNDKGKTGQNN